MMASKIISSRMGRSNTLRTAAGSFARRPTTRYHSSCVPAVHVPVVSYHDGERTTSDIQCHTTVAPCAHDLKRKAEPLRSEILDGLTPTLKKFTLAGKIVVVTGYAQSPYKLKLVLIPPAQWWTWSGFQHDASFGGSWSVWNRHVGHQSRAW